MPDAAARPHHLTVNTPVGGLAHVQCERCGVSAHAPTICGATAMADLMPCPGVRLDHVADAVEVDPHVWPGTWHTRHGH